MCLREAGVRSSTDSFQDAREHVSHQIEEFAQCIQPIPGQVGAVFFGKRGVIGAEFLASPDLFSRCIDKIVRSFAFEVLSAPSLNGTSADTSKAWWAEMLQSPFSKHDSVGVGVDIRTEANNMIDLGLMYGKVVIHFSGFPNLKQREDRTGASLVCS